MESRWKELTKALFSSPEAREKWWDRICQALAGKEGRRHYYNLENLENRFVLFDKYQNQLSNPTAVALAMFLQQLVIIQLFKIVCFLTFILNFN